MNFKIYSVKRWKPEDNKIKKLKFKKKEEKAKTPNCCFTNSFYKLTIMICWLFHYVSRHSRRARWNHVIYSFASCSCCEDSSKLKVSYKVFGICQQSFYYRTVLIFAHRQSFHLKVEIFEVPPKLLISGFFSNCRWHHLKCRFVAIRIPYSSAGGLLSRDLQGLGI